MGPHLFSFITRNNKTALAGICYGHNAMAILDSSLYFSNIESKFLSQTQGVVSSGTLLT